MADVVLFHHLLGLTDGVRALAARVTAAGHRVTTPDLFEGRTFSALPDGEAYLNGIGLTELGSRATTAIAALDGPLVFMGISLGVMQAQRLAQDPDHPAAGAVLLEAFADPDYFGGWPDDLLVQVHGMDADPFFAGEGDLAAASKFAESYDEAEVFTYPGEVHLFTDSSLETYDAQAADLVVERVLEFLDRLSVSN